MASAKKLDLALQGGGAHGAYTWGVLDRLLEDDRIDIEGISGTSRSRRSGRLFLSDAIGCERGRAVV